jgi:hypothetical protein
MDSKLNTNNFRSPYVHWVSATATRNFATDDPLLDWLNLYGETKGFRKDKDYDEYDERTDFSRFIMNKGIEFEAAVATHLSSLIPMYTVLEDGDDRSDPKLVNKTIDAMRSGSPLIYQALLSDDKSHTYGFADFLIRSDKLIELFPDSISKEESMLRAPALGNENWHYRVIDAKFTTLGFNVGGDIAISGSMWGYILQIFIYNRALGAMQGYTAPGGYLLGRKWKQRIEGENHKGSNCMDRLAYVPADYNSKSKGQISKVVEEACTWIRWVRKEGHSWDVVPHPTVSELRPNMGSKADQPWHLAKAEIDDQLKDLTSLWGVGVKKRNEANKNGILRWDQRNYTSIDVGVTGPKTSQTLNKIITLNRDISVQPVSPILIKNCDQIWREDAPLEFYVDFETVSDLNDDFSMIPFSGGQTLIFMIGCGHIENEEWKWSCFITDSLIETSEAEVIDQWLNHMRSTQARIGQTDKDPLVFHWSHAEQSTFQTSFNSAANRQPEKKWDIPNWYDFHTLVMKANPVVIRGSLGFGLKQIAKAMKKLGLIETVWGDGPTDGLGAMVGAWFAAKEALESKIPMNLVPLMKEIAEYNEVDCRVMFEIIEYLRKNH